MPNSSPTATKMASAFIALTVFVSVVAVGGVAQTDTEINSPSSGDTEPNDEMANATHISSDENIDANLSSGSDVDWYAVNVTAGNAVIPHLYLQNESDGRSIQVRLYNASGENVTAKKNDAMGGPENVAGGEGSFGELDAHAVAPNVATANATYYVRVSESLWDEAGENTTSPYNLTVRTKNLDQYDPNEDGPTATNIDSTDSVDAVMTPYDHDVYAVNLTAGASYTVSFEYTGADTGDRFSMALRLTEDVNNITDNQQFGSDSGRMLTELHGDDETVTTTVNETGTYYLHLGQYLTNQLLNEDAYKLTIQNESRVPAGDRDTDGDGLTNEEEAELGTDPSDTDTDGDGWSDLSEVNRGCDPLDADSHQ